MAFTNAELQAIYAQLNQGSAGPAVDQATVIALATQTRAGQISDAEALQAVYDLVDDTTGVAALTYQFFTGSLPTAAGFAFLVNSATNTTDLNDPYYQNFNQENRLINFSLNLALGTPANQTAFAATYGAPTTLQQAVALAYETIIGRANAEARGIDVDAAVAFLTNSANVAFYTQIATTRGGIPANDPVRLDLAVKAIAIAELLNAAMLQDVGNYADSLNQFYASLIDATPGSPGFGANLLEAFPPAASVTLTANADTLTANVFNAPRVFTPGGNDQVNSLNDDDVLTGVGANPTLNVQFVNDSDTGDTDIAPRLNNIAVINVDVRLDGDGILDLQDATGTRDINLDGIDDPYSFTVDNINFGGVSNLSINDSEADTSVVSFLFDDDDIGGLADVTKLTLDDAQVGGVVLQGADGATQEGFETINVVSVGGNNEVGVLTAQDVKTLNITGNSNLTFGGQSNIVGPVNNLEAIYRSGGFANVAGSLATVDASTFTGNLDIAFGGELSADIEGSSGDPIAFKFLGGSGNDTVRLLGGAVVGDEDSLNGGGGTNTLYVEGNTVIAPTATANLIAKFQNLDIRTGHDLGAGIDVVTVDANRLPDLVNTTVRNEGALFFSLTSTPEEATVNLNNYTDAQASNITVLHSTTGNNGLFGGLNLIVDHKTNTATNTVGITIGAAANTDDRFNFDFNAAEGELLTITDSDNESNTVRNFSWAVVTDLTIKGGQVGKFLNLDTGRAGFGFGTDEDVTGIEGMNADSGSIPPLTDLAGVSDLGTSGSERYGGNVDASTFTGDLIVRVDALTGKSYKGGSGNDIFVFDSLGNTRAGLTISDTADGGAGTDTLAIDGDGVQISIGASEWTNVKNFENIRLVGNAFSANMDEVIAASPVALAGKIGDNDYNIVLTNDLINNNGVDAGGGNRRINIINDGGNNTADERGVTIDARSLAANRSFTYDGEESAGGPTKDRIIMSDANINGLAIINGGSGLAAWVNDVIEVRNAAVVTIGDLANVSNIGNLLFTNDSATTQSSVLELNQAVVDALAPGVDPLRIIVQGNAAVPLALTELTIEDTGVTPGSYIVYTDGPGNAVVTINGGGALTFVGGIGNDLVNGSAFADNLSGNGGADTLNGGGGNDTLSGGAGDDQLNGGNGADLISGDGGNDTINGGDGNDTISGGANADTIVGGNGADLIAGGLGSDTIDLSEAVSSVDTVGWSFENEGADIVTGFNLANDRIAFGDGFTELGTRYDDTTTSLISYTVAANGDGGAIAFDVDGGANFEGAQISQSDSELTFADLANIALVVAEIAEEFTFTNTSVGEEIVFLIQSDDGWTGVYHYQSLDGNNTVDAGEITLLGRVDALLVGNTHAQGLVDLP